MAVIFLLQNADHRKFDVCCTLYECLECEIVWNCVSCVSNL